jgi:hypothetical protein
MMPDKIKDDSEILFRQIHPSFLQDGQPSSQPFCPTAKDENKLSVDRSSLTTASESFALFQSNGFATVAIYGLSVGEFREQALPCRADPLEKTEAIAANPAHACVDYGAHKPAQQKVKAKRLKLSAVARGRLHPREGDAG